MFADGVHSPHNPPLCVCVCVCVCVSVCVCVCLCLCLSLYILHHTNRLYCTTVNRNSLHLNRTQMRRICTIKSFQNTTSWPLYSVLPSWQISYYCHQWG